MNNNKKIFFLILSLIIIILIFNAKLIFNSQYYGEISKKYKNMETISNDILDLPNNYYNKDLSNEKLVIITSHYNEDLSWLKYIKLPFIISSKKTIEKNLYIDINRGNEASGYLKYIITHYDNLPEYSIFIHGHYIDWHQNMNIIDIINGLNNIVVNKKINYLNFNNRSWNGQFYNDYRKNIWNKLFLEELGPIPDKLYDKCCAQFIVNKDRIRLRSKKFYENLLNFSLTNNMDTKYSNFGHVLEYLWHYIFGEPAIINREEDNLALFEIKYFENPYK